MRGAEQAASPLGDSELDGIFAPFADARLIALAVSGGADSLALLVAAERWQKARGGRPEILVLTVNHRLRRGSAGEARMVVDVARARGLNARTLVRRGAVFVSDIEAEARRARYRLLIDAAVKAGASHLLTAHHRDDVAEGFLLRLARGAGVFGLAAMRPAIAVNGLTIARPFLSIARARLAATTAAAGLTPVVDPMNADPRYARARVRSLLPHLAAEGLGAAEIAEAAVRMAAAADAIDAAATRFIADAVATNPIAVACFDPAVFGDLPGEVRRRVLVRMLIAVGGDDYPPRFERLSALLAAMAERSPGGRFKRTLAGTVIEFRDGRFMLYREIGREPPPAIGLRPGFAGVWDHRFSVRAGRALPAGLTVAALGEDGRRAIGAGATSGVAGALAAVPAVRRGREIVGVPAIGYFANRGRDLPLEVRSIVDQRLRQPPLFPDFGSAG